MTQEALVIFVNLVVHQGLLAHRLTAYALLETLDDFLHDRLVENHALARHHTQHITACEQFSALQTDTVATRIEHVNPQFFVENLTREDKHLNLRIGLLGLTADFHTDGGGTVQSEVEQHEVGLLLFDESPVSRLILCRSDDFRLRNLVTENTFGTLQFQGNILHNDYFEIFHIVNILSFLS